jgi:uncharacterized protein YlbG (UPF0298 family)
MWLIEYQGKFHIWENTIKDDFLRFIPHCLGCGSEDISAYWVGSVEDQKLILSKENEVKIKSDSLGIFRKSKKIRYAKVDENNQEIEIIKEEVQEEQFIKEVEAKKLVRWPYSENGEFQGNKFDEQTE